MWPPFLIHKMKGGGATMTTYEAISLMISFAGVVISLVSLVVLLIKAITGQKKIITPAPQAAGDYF